MIALSVSLREDAAAVSPTRERSAPRIGLRPHLAGAHKSDLQLVGCTMLLAGVPTSNRDPVAAEEPAPQLHLAVRPAEYATWLPPMRQACGEA